MTAHFQSHPLARTVLGSTRSVSALTSHQMLDYFQSRYSPGNMVLSVSGKIDFPRLVTFVERRCGDWEPTPAPRETPRADPHQGLQVFYKESSIQQYVVQIANGPAVEDDQRYAARVLATVLGDDSGSRMFWDLIDTGLAECAAMGSYEYQGTGLLMTYLSCSPEDTEENLERIDQIYQQAEAEGVTDEELTQAKSKILSHIVLQSERPANRLFSVGNNWLQHRQYRTVRETMDLYQRVTREDVRAVLDRYHPSVHTTVATGPLKELLGIRAEPLPEPTNSPP